MGKLPSDVLTDRDKDVIARRRLDDSYQAQKLIEKSNSILFLELEDLTLCSSICSFISGYNIRPDRVVEVVLHTEPNALVEVKTIDSFYHPKVLKILGDLSTAKLNCVGIVVNTNFFNHMKQQQYNKLIADIKGICGQKWPQANLVFHE